MYGKAIKESSYIQRTYRLETKLGSGGSGAVYLAWHSRLNKHVVIKVVESCSSEDIRIHRNEVEALKNIKSLHIPQVLDFFIESEKSYTVMEFIDGISFDKLLKWGERFLEAQVITWYNQLALTLELIHKNDIFHRDIKPANIMLTKSGDVCLIDFNSAFVSGNNTGLISRSMGYASPEQYEYFKVCKNRQAGEPHEMKTYPEYLETSLLAGDCKTEPMLRQNTAILSVNNQIDWKLSDIYSLGATVFHLLTGKRPPVTAGDVAKITKLKGYSKALLKVMEKSMQSEPSERFASANELGAKVQHLIY